MFGTPILPDRNVTTKITVNVKSVGQECPTHTITSGP